MGTTLRRAGQGGLGYYSLSSADEAAALHRTCDFAESVYLATCNRVQVFFVGRPGCAVATYRRRIFDFFAARTTGQAPLFADARGLTAYADEGAVEHLFVVAAALDSLVPGEAQILGQVKAALSAAQEQGLAGAELSKTFADAFAIAKDVRENTALGRGRTSMFSLATSLIAAHIAEARAPGLQRMAIVGVGDMTDQCARWAQAQGGFDLVFVNRTLARAQALARSYGGTAVALPDFVAAPGALQVLVSATSSQTPLFLEPCLRQMGRQTLLIDLAVPRDIDLSAARRCGLPLWDVDRLQTRASAHAAARRTQLGEARARIDEALERYRMRRLGHNVGAAIDAWRKQSQAVLQRELEDVVRTTARQISDEERARLTEALTLFGRRLLGQWLHGPTLGLKEVGRHFGSEAIDAFADVALAAPTRARPAAQRTEP